MTAFRCYLCAQDPLEKRRYGQPTGTDCPICQQSTCNYHLTTVRFRWRSDGQTASALICKECKRTYAHRNWDIANREWIT
jgi:C4-type Zn-finger protein